MMTAWALLLGLGAVEAIVFAVLYAVDSPGWWRSPMGRNLMAMDLVIAGLTGVSLAALRLHVWAWVFLGGMASMDAVIAWRILILLRLQRKGGR